MVQRLVLGRRRIRIKVVKKKKEVSISFFLIVIQIWLVAARRLGKIAENYVFANKSRNGV